MPLWLRFARLTAGTGIFTICALCLPARVAWANSTGITGFSSKQGPICNTCHSGGGFPEVSFEGPVTLSPGAMATYRFVVRSGGQSQRHAGFNVAADAGTLGVVAGQGAQRLGTELTHTSPKQNVDGQASWDFTWQAPLTPGSYSLYGAGNSVRVDGTQLGDRASSREHVIDVLAETPTPTPTPVPPTETPTPTPAPVPPTETPSPPPTSTSTSEATATRRDTPTSTATRTASGTVTPTATPTPTETPRGPSPGDANCDGAINAADLVANLLRRSDGEVGECLFADANCDQLIDDEDLLVVLARLFGAPAPACLPD
jgi:hypothetical protein